MENMKDMKIVDFAALTASDAPVPGGGSLSALSGALAAALAEMVANLTIGKKKYIEVENEMNDIVKDASVIRSNLLEFIQKDSDSFDKVMDAFKLPKETDEQKAERTKVVQESYKYAASIPMEVAKTSFDVLKLAELCVDNGNSNSVTDALVSAMMARTAVLGALYNVKINILSIKDTSYVDNMNKEIKELEEKTLAYEKKILAKSGL